MICDHDLKNSLIGSSRSSSVSSPVKMMTGVFLKLKSGPLMAFRVPCSSSFLLTWTCVLAFWSWFFCLMWLMMVSRLSGTFTANSLRETSVFRLIAEFFGLIFFLSFLLLYQTDSPWPWCWWLVALLIFRPLLFHLCWTRLRFLDRAFFFTRDKKYDFYFCHTFLGHPKLFFTQVETTVSHLIRVLILIDLSGCACWRPRKCASQF